MTIVVTADQVGSTTGPDLAADALAALAGDPRIRTILPPDRTAGDELQLIAADGASALEAALTLTRDGMWSVGVGIGPVRMPLAGTTRESNGEAFAAARDAVDRAKARTTRFALEAADADSGSDAEALIDLLLVLRGRRTPEGWGLFDALRDGGTQADAAQRLGITPQAASSRAQAASLRTEAAAVPALARLLDAVDTARE